MISPYTGQANIFGGEVGQNNLICISSLNYSNRNPHPNHLFFPLISFSRSFFLSPHLLSPRYHSSRQELFLFPSQDRRDRQKFTLISQLIQIEFNNVRL